ncbi:MAG: NADP-dependent phosphogluconate dehydrogenase [Fimbriimonadaceae bacterium]
MEGAHFGIVGLGRIGGRLGLQALAKGYRVAGHDLSGPSEELAAAGLLAADSLSDLVSKLARPRIVFLYVHAGPTVDSVAEELVPLLEPGDIVADGGNSYWGDSRRRAQRLAPTGIRWVDLGTSGGLEGARNGACFMLGGDPEAARVLEPILTRLAVPGGYVYAGPSGSGHFVKLVHNGIEFGMLQAIGEGVDLLERFDDPLPVADVLACWRNGSVIRSWLVDLMHKAYADREGMGDVPGFVEDTGEVNWLVGDAIRMEVPIPVIAQSVMQLFASRDDDRRWARAVALMRQGFGGHPLGPEPELRRERQIGRIGDIWRPTSED